MWVPSEEVLNMKFLKHHNFFVYVYLNKPYIITAKISGTKNFIGFGIDGNIYLLDRENNRVIYVSSALAVFARQLIVYRDYVAAVNSDNENDNNDNYSENSAEITNENKPQNDIKTIISKIRILDKYAFSNEENFWSGIVKQIQPDLIL